MKKTYYFILIICVCLFSFLGGIAGELIKDNMLFAEEKEPLTLKSLDNRLKRMENAITVHENNIKFGIFDEIIATKISVRDLSLVNKNYNTVAKLNTYKKRPRFMFYTDEEPYNKGDGKKQKYCGKPKLVMDYDGLYLGDIDNELRLTMTVHNFEPQLKFLYKNKTRLLLGSNNLVTKKTGTDTKIEGSIVSFDKNGNVSEIFPNNY